MSDTYGGGFYGGGGTTTPPPAGITELVLDPIEVAGARTALSLNAGPIRVGEDGPDWGDAQIEAYMAEQSRGSLPVDFRLPNRTIAIPLLLGASGSLEYLAGRAQLHNKVALIQREGGWLRRGAGVYADLVNAAITTPDKWGWRGLEPDIVLTLEAIPDFYGDETALGTHSETSLNELVFVETGIEGDYPGRVRIQVTEADGNAQFGLIWGVRSRYYSSAPTARLAYAGWEMTPVGSAARAVGPTGNAITHGNLGVNWTPVASTDLEAAGMLTHTGSYRVFARVYSPNGSAVQCRLVWDVGDLALPVQNSPATVPDGGQIFIVDFGSVRLDEPPVGVHRWGGQIQAKGTVGGEDFTLNRFWMVPADEGMGVLRASTTQLAVSADPAGYDNFGGSGNLTGQGSPTGFVWGAAGPAPDFVESGLQANRTSASDAFGGGRFALATGSGYLTDTGVQVTVARNTGIGLQGAVARYASPTSFVMAALRVSTGSGPTPVYEFGVWKDYVLLLGKVAIPPVAPATYFTIRLVVDRDGRWSASFFSAGSPGPSTPMLQGQDIALATGGGRASGQVGFYDEQTSDAANRAYDNFSFWVPEDSDAVLHPNRSAELRWDGMYRETSDGSAYGPVSRVTGDLPRIPVSGMESRPVEFFIKGSRGEIGQLPDSGVDDITARVFYRPSWLFKDDGG